MLFLRYISIYVSLKIFGQLSISAPFESVQGALIFAIHA